MKTITFLIGILLSVYTHISVGQENLSVNDFDFESVSNPSFIVLDETPTLFSLPDNLKALGLYLSNGFSNTNIAVEINPYWVLGWHKEDTSYESYRGISTIGERVRIDPFKRIKTNSSLSLSFIDKEFPNLEGARKTLTLGGRMTVLELYNKKAITQLTEVLAQVEGAFSNKVLNDFDGYLRGPSPVFPDLATPSDPEVCASFLENGTYPQEYVEAAQKYFEVNRVLVQSQYEEANALLRAYFKESCGVSAAFIFNAQEIQPVFRLDGAVGYSWLFQENTFNSATVNRFGSWLTGDLALRLTATQYLHIYGIARYIDDGFQIDQAGAFTTLNFLDFGGKIALEIDKFKFSYEYIERTGDQAMYRSVGNIYYQLTKNMGITGGFGKDFQVQDNLISILGISWGIDSGEAPFGQ